MAARSMAMTTMTIGTTQIITHPFDPFVQA